MIVMIIMITMLLKMTDADSDNDFGVNAFEGLVVWVSDRKRIRRETVVLRLVSDEYGL